MIHALVIQKENLCPCFDHHYCSSITIQQVSGDAHIEQHLTSMQRMYLATEWGSSRVDNNRFSGHGGGIRWSL